MFGFIIGNIAALPLMMLFYVVWTGAMLLRPFLLACFFCLLLNPQATLNKLNLMCYTIAYMIVTKDKTWKAPPAYNDVSVEDLQELLKSINHNDSGLEKKHVVFVRHGESTWNDTFNRGDRSVPTFVLGFVPNLVYALFMEGYFFVSGRSQESWFYDAPLSYPKGVSQALKVQEFLNQQQNDTIPPREAQYIQYMVSLSKNDYQDDENDKSKRAILVCSNLRRAISTMAIGFQSRMSSKQEKILLMPQLQEMSRNPDALCITPPYSSHGVTPSYTDVKYDNFHLSKTKMSAKPLQDLLQTQIDTRWHDGNKDMIKSNGLIRMMSFCEDVFSKEELRTPECLIVGGHSLWFRSFFRTFLPSHVKHICKAKKIVNGGVVGFVLIKTPQDEKKKYPPYIVDPTSITVLYGGF